MKFSSREWGCVWGLCVCSNFLWCNYSILIFQLFYFILFFYNFLSSTNGHVLVVVWHYLCYSLCTEYSVPNPHLIHKIINIPRLSHFVIHQIHGIHSYSMLHYTLSPIFWCTYTGLWNLIVLSILHLSHACTYLHRKFILQSCLDQMKENFKNWDVHCLSVGSQEFVES